MLLRRPWEPVEGGVWAPTHAVGRLCEERVHKLARCERLKVFGLLADAPRKINKDSFLDVLHRKSLPGEGWSEPHPAFKGYGGALLGGVQMDNGRILLPLGMWQKPGQRLTGGGQNSIGAVRAVPRRQSVCCLLERGGRFQSKKVGPLSSALRRKSSRSINCCSATWSFAAATPPR